ncbi:hypothetical protein [Chitiniphilus eburneus]|uniref:Uncharacterized protein n=1 Tax=Chitiniphilus eburneus TaxID=2571148 RepID=A0A4V5MP78_9NEIS|nr:hypothetical protein [Chitiniphilus eburneus]TJZ66818.1 hypothetical protein FAZ21_16670 [Chitiniphilus eburneus]
MASSSASGTDLRASHVPSTIAGCEAAVIKSNDDMTVYGPKRDDGTISPFPHVTVRKDSVHMSDMVNTKGTLPPVGSTLSLKRHFAGPNAPGPKGTKVQVMDDAGTTQMVTSGGQAMSAPLSPRTSTNTKARFEVAWTKFEEAKK